MSKKTTLDNIPPGGFFRLREGGAVYIRAYHPVLGEAGVTRSGGIYPQPGNKPVYTAEPEEFLNIDTSNPLSPRPSPSEEYEP
jgi:hypothetical protein